MEASLSDTEEAHQSFRSPPRRRRSTFFERKDSIVPQQLIENVDTDTLKKDIENKKRTREMSRYYEKLLTEKEQWKREVKERRNKYHDLREQYQMAAKAPSRSRLSYSTLSNEDIEFLKAKPNVSNLATIQQDFHRSVRETMALVRRAHELDKTLLDFCEEKVDRITEHILDNSTVE